MSNSTNSSESESENKETRLTKREHFAAIAMQGLLSSGSMDSWNAARFAVEAADCLLEELNNRRKPS